MKIDLDGLGHALSDNRLRVPRYQRDYAWEDKHVKDLYEDLAAARDANETEYFLGSIVVVGSSKSDLSVADGQQRLATTSFLLAAIRDYFYVAGDTQRAEGIERKYLSERDIRSQELLPHLRLNQADHDFYSKRVLSSPDQPDRQVQPTRQSHKRIARAVELAAEQVQAIVKGTSRPVDRLLDWIDYIEARATVIWVQVPDDTNAFRIFETLNDRGLALAISDLLKNYLFSLAGDRIDEIQQRWISMLASIDQEESVVSFIRHYWLSMYEVKRERELYDAIKKRVTSKSGAIEFADDVARLAPSYQSILNPDDAFETKYGQPTRVNISTLNLLGMVQIRPLLLAVLDKFNTEEVRKSLRLFVAWSVRFVIVGGLGGGTLERHYSQRAVEVRNGKLTRAAQLAKALQDVVPRDVVFKNAFANHIEPKAKIARYYLRVLEMQVSGGAKPALIPNPDSDSVNLEHVLPQNPSTGWGLSDDVVRAYANRLGNLALLEKKLNSKVANGPFSGKRPEYKASKLSLTNQLQMFSGWGVTEIEQRQKDLAELAVKAWWIA